MSADTATTSKDLRRRARSLVSDPRFLLLGVVLIALFLRFWRLESVPPGWRDDELINSLVISQKVLDGDWALYYADASGHEALYHILSAATLGAFGPGVPGIRWLPAILGTATILLTFLLASQLLGRKVALLASLALAFSFWSLMYSRIGIRHILLPVTMLAAFYSFWRGLRAANSSRTDQQPDRTTGNRSSPATWWFISAGFFMGASFYTYFASRGLPVILLLFFVYLVLFQRKRALRIGWGVLIMFFLAAFMAIPLVRTLMSQPESESRVEELAVPLTEAAGGNLRPLLDHTLRTLSMFHAGGDDEWLYNIPNRPVFGPIAAAFFWAGVAVAIWYASKPLLRISYKAVRDNSLPGSLAFRPGLESASAFLLIWWLVGISPGFFSVPAASLGHTIVAQSAVYILAALPILPFAQWLHRRYPEKRVRNEAFVIIAALALLLAIAWRDLPDYFDRWPARGMTRFLYRAEIKDLADYLNEQEELTDFAVSGLLAGPWDRLALEIDLHDEERTHPRWFNPERAVVLQLGNEEAAVFSGYPSLSTLHPELYTEISEAGSGDYRLARIEGPPLEPADPVCFTNGLCLLAADYDGTSGSLELTWSVEQPLELPPQPLVSNPPPPGVYAGPRLSVFAQLVDTDGAYLDGDDGLWVDTAGLMVGDRFLQQHRLSAPAGRDAAAVLFGLYDPMSGTRIPTRDGRDHLRLELAAG